MINTINISLPSQLKSDSEKIVKDGQYTSFSDLVRTTLRKLIEETNYNQLAKLAKKEFIEW
jgi:Arc/MetJ-type ribon-helix-helix transcriptional regulator